MMMSENKFLNSDQIDEFIEDWKNRTALVALQISAHNGEAKRIHQMHWEYLLELMEMVKAGAELKSDKNPLSRREQEVLFLVAKGLSNREVSHQLGIHQRTVEFHLKSIFSKTETTNRTEAVAFALQNRLISA